MGNEWDPFTQRTTLLVFPFSLCLSHSDSHSTSSSLSILAHLAYACLKPTQAGSGHRCRLMAVLTCGLCRKVSRLLTHPPALLPCHFPWNIFSCQVLLKLITLVLMMRQILTRLNQRHQSENSILKRNENNCEEQGASQSEWEIETQGCRANNFMNKLSEMLSVDMNIYFRSRKEQLFRESTQNNTEISMYEM